MNWLANPESNDSNICPKSACLSNGACYKWNTCKSNGACAIKFGGTCTKKACVIYVA